MAPIYASVVKGDFCISVLTQLTEDALEHGRMELAFDFSGGGVAYTNVSCAAACTQGGDVEASPGCPA